MASLELSYQNVPSATWYSEFVRERPLVCRDRRAVLTQVVVSPKHGQRRARPYPICMEGDHLNVWSSTARSRRACLYLNLFGVFLLELLNKFLLGPLGIFLLGSVGCVPARTAQHVPARTSRHVPARTAQDVPARRVPTRTCLGSLSQSDLAIFSRLPLKPEDFTLQH